MFSTSTGKAEVSNVVYAARKYYLGILQAAATSSAEPKIEGKRSNILSINFIDSHQTEKSRRLEARDEVEEVVLDSQRSNQVVHSARVYPPLSGVR